MASRPSASGSGTASTSSVKVVVAGGANCDYVIDVLRLPVIGETVGGTSVDGGRPALGGKGANTSVAAARMGADTCFIGGFGDDSDGGFLKERLSSFGVDISTAAFTLRGEASGKALIFRLPNGENCIVSVNSVNQKWPETLTDAQVSVIANADVILLQRAIPESVNLRLAKVAAKHKVPVVLDIGGRDTLLSSEMLDLVTIASPNQTESGRMADLSTVDPKDESAFFKAIQRLNEKHEMATLLKLGSRGCALIRGSKDAVIKVPALELSSELVVDTTGAGDCFTGSFAVEWTRAKKDISACFSQTDAFEKAMRFAVTSAGLSVQKKGCAKSIPTLKQVFRCGLI